MIYLRIDSCYRNQSSVLFIHLCSEQNLFNQWLYENEPFEDRADYFSIKRENWYIKKCRFPLNNNYLNDIEQCIIYLLWAVTRIWFNFKTNIKLKELILIWIKFIIKRHYFNATIKQCMHIIEIIICFYTCNVIIICMSTVTHCTIRICNPIFKRRFSLILHLSIYLISELQYVLFVAFEYLSVVCNIKFWIKADYLSLPLHPLRIVYCQHKLQRQVISFMGNSIN